MDKILRNLDVAKTSGIDQISVKFLKDIAPLIAIHLVNHSSCYESVYKTSYFSFEMQNNKSKIFI